MADGGLLKSLQAGEKLAISFSGEGADNPLVINGSLKGIADGMMAINLK